MSSETKNFSTAMAQEFVSDAKSQIEAARTDAPQQLDLLSVPSPELMADAKAEMPDASARQVLEVARGRGRRPGSRNKATQEFKRWILSYGQHPAVTLMQIQSTPPEILMENSKRRYTRLDRHGNPVEILVEMTYSEAQGLRKQCAAELMPFLESKQPVAVDMSFTGLSDLVMAGFTHSHEEVQDIINAEFVAVGEDGEIEDGDWEGGE